MMNDRKILQNPFREEKLDMGPTSPNPGPTLLRQVMTELVAVRMSVKQDMTMLPTAKVKM